MKKKHVIYLNIILQFLFLKCSVVFLSVVDQLTIISIRRVILDWFDYGEDMLKWWFSSSFLYWKTPFCIWCGWSYEQRGFSLSWIRWSFSCNWIRRSCLLPGKTYTGQGSQMVSLLYTNIFKRKFHGTFLEHLPIINLHVGGGGSAQFVKQT